MGSGGPIGTGRGRTVVCALSHPRPGRAVQRCLVHLVRADRARVALESSQPGDGISCSGALALPVEPAELLDPNLQFPTGTSPTPGLRVRQLRAPVGE